MESSQITLKVENRKANDEMERFINMLDDFEGSDYPLDVVVSRSGEGQQAAKRMERDPIEIARMLKKYADRMAGIDALELPLLSGEDGGTVEHFLRQFVTQESVSAFLEFISPGASYVYENIAEIMPKLKKLFYD